MKSVVKLLRGGKDIRKHEVEECPKFMHVVLQGCARDEQLVDRTALAHCLRNERCFILDSLSLIQNDIAVGAVRQH